jgi:hypothetical protein
VKYDGERALELLRRGSGLPDALFREGQEEAIRHVVEGRGRLLVVQRTGWGKSFVYFIATKLLREAGLGPTLLVSPLLALMRNQMLATANDRVMADLSSILGPELEVLRGALHRPSLALQTIRLPSQAERLAWLAEQVPKLPGHGIVYTLTKRDAGQVTAWLRSRGLEVEAYTSESGDRRDELERALLENRVKALVATTALGMGFDKPDLGFVIHYQAPGSVVAYYQQVGRAGRALDGEPGEDIPADLPALPVTASPETVREAIAFLRRTNLPIEPRKKWPAGGLPSYGVSGLIETGLQARPGKALCLWGDAGWGSDVRRGKYRDGRFSEELVEASLQLIHEWDPEPAPGWVTCIPSRRHPDLVLDFARRLASRLALPFEPILVKLEERPEQKRMANSAQQARNVDGALALAREDLLDEPVLLVDDMVDSRWTLTVAAWLLRSHGSGEVRPFVLAQAGGGP